MRVLASGQTQAVACRAAAPRDGEGFARLQRRGQFVEAEGPRRAGRAAVEQRRPVARRQDFDAHPEPVEVGRGPGRPGTGEQGVAQGVHRQAQQEEGVVVAAVCGVLGAGDAVAALPDPAAKLAHRAGAAVVALVALDIAGEAAASATANPQGTALALAVQPLDTWREMWVFRQDAQGWQADVLPPGNDKPGLGYVEFAGWVPGGKQMLAAREIRSDGRHKSSFEVLRLTTLEVEKLADKPGNLSTFYRWQSPLWKSQTVAIR